MTATCMTCEGCGKVATDDDCTPWHHWEAIPPPANLSVTLGLIRPVTCPDCGGSGQTSAVKTARIGSPRRAR